MIIVMTLICNFSHQNLHHSQRHTQQLHVIVTLFTPSAVPLARLSLPRPPAGVHLCISEVSFNMLNNCPNHLFLWQILYLHHCPEKDLITQHNNVHIDYKSMHSHFFEVYLTYFCSQRPIVFNIFILMFRTFWRWMEYDQMISFGWVTTFSLSCFVSYWPFEVRKTVLIKQCKQIKCWPNANCPLYEMTTPMSCLFLVGGRSFINNIKAIIWQWTNYVSLTA